MQGKFSPVQNPFLKQLWRSSWLAGLICLTGVPGVRGSANQTEEAKQYFYKAMNGYEEGNSDRAMTNLKLALEAQPNFEEAVLLKGLLLSRDGSSEEAQRCFTRATTLVPRATETVRNQLLKQVQDMTATHEVKEVPHFRWRYPSIYQIEQSSSVQQSLADAYTEWETLVGAAPRDAISVVVFSPGEYWEAWKGPLWLDNFFDHRDGTIRLQTALPPGGELEFQRRLRHQFIHAFLNPVYPKLPVWFQEGIAQYYADQQLANPQWKLERLAELKQILEGAPWLDIERVEQNIEKKGPTPGLMYLSYLESEALVLSVAQVHGESWLAAFFQRLRAGDSFPAAWNAVVGMSPSQTLETVQHTLETAASAGIK